jgi:hypothetical protein
MRRARIGNSLQEASEGVGEEEREDEFDCPREREGLASEEVGEGGRGEKGDLTLIRTSPYLTP